MTELILTETERARLQEDLRIAAEYRAMREQNPGAAVHRIIRSIAASGKFKSKSIGGVRMALIRTNSISVNRKNA